MWDQPVVGGGGYSPTPSPQPSGYYPGYPGAAPSYPAPSCSAGTNPASAEPSAPPCPPPLTTAYCGGEKGWVMQPPAPPTQQQYAPTCVQPVGAGFIPPPAAPSQFL